MRKTAAKRRGLDPDPRYQDEMVTRFVNNMMVQGKKSRAFTIFYIAMDILDKGEHEEDGYTLWKKALANVSPQVEVRSRRIGGATFQIPTEIRGDRKTAQGMKWLIRFARERRGKSMGDKLAAEILAASKGEGAAVKKKEDTHRMADANKAFSHFRV